MERLFLRSKPLLHNIRPAIVQSRFTHHLRVSNLYLHHHQTTVQTNKETIRFYHSDRIPWQDDLVGTYSTNEGDSVSVTKFMTDLLASGLRGDDPRFKGALVKLQEEADLGVISRQKFMETASSSLPLIRRALHGDFIIPDFRKFISVINTLYEECVDIKEGELAKYIPQLARIDPHLWGVSLCTIDGQRHSIGDKDFHFTMQSGSKCFTYGIAVEEYGSRLIHKYIGKEPSGQSFNSLTLTANDQPHNPMINAGALILSSIIRPDDTLTERTNFVLQKYCGMAGELNQSIKCDIMTCDSEMETAHRNYALLHYMKERKVLPPNAEIEETLKFYTRLCSVELDCQRGAVMAATLANSGRCPTTGTKVLSDDTVRQTLSLMNSCGMYDSAGEFTFTIGLPAKSGVSGIIIVVVPNVMGFCLYSPLVNNNGNSLRGMHFCKRLVDTFNFHSYDIGTASKKIDPRIRKGADKNLDTPLDPQIMKGADKNLDIHLIMSAAKSGALEMLQGYKKSGLDLNGSNYDGRTPLHVASAEGHCEVVEMLLSLPNISINAKDRWSCTPLDEALLFEHRETAALLERRGAERGTGMRQGGGTRT